MKDAATKERFMDSETMDNEKKNLTFEEFVKELAELLKEGKTSDQIIEELQLKRKTITYKPFELLFIFEELVKNGIIKKDKDKPSCEEIIEIPEVKKIAEEKGVLKIEIRDADKEVIEFLKRELRKKELEIKRLKAIPLKVKLPRSYLDSLYQTKESLEKIKPHQLNQLKGITTTKDFEIFKDGFEQIDLTVGEHRCLITLFALYTKNNFQPIALHWADFYRAYGLKERETKRKSREFGINEVREVRQTLKKLETKLVPIVYRCYVGQKKDKEKLYNVIMVKKPLIRVIDFYKGITDKEIEDLGLPEEIKRIKDYAKEKHLVLFMIEPILLNRHKNYFKLIDRDFYEKLKKVKGKERRITKYDFNFYLWLAKQTNSVVEINRDFLARDVLKMSNKTIKKIPKYVNETILDLYKTFKRLEYLNDYKLNKQKVSGGLKDMLCLNI